MTYEIIVALMIFALVSTCTPGPNNIMLLASGMNYGIIRTFPHMLGIMLGFPAMVFMIGIGLGQVFNQIPYSYEVLKIVSTAYLLYLAWKIATASKPDTKTSQRSVSSRPLTFLQAASFQWVNPKAWTIALSTISVYSTTTGAFSSIVIISLVFILAGLVSTSLWTILGDRLRKLIQDELKLRIFNITCAVLLVATLYPIVFG